MSWFISIVVALMTGALSLLLAGFIANLCVGWYHITSREGASGFFIVSLALAGGITGVVVGFIAARIAASKFGSGFFVELLCACLVVLLLAGVAIILCRLSADVPPELSGRQLDLEIEFRLPANDVATNDVATNDVAAPPNDMDEWRFELSSVSGGTVRASRTGEIERNSVRLEDGRWIVPARVFLFSERGSRAIILRRESESLGGFLVPLPRRPSAIHESWSRWLPVQQADGQPWPAEKVSYRFRVTKQP